MVWRQVGQFFIHSNQSILLYCGTGFQSGLVTGIGLGSVWHLQKMVLLLLLLLYNVQTAVHAVDTCAAIAAATIKAQALFLYHMFELFVLTVILYVCCCCSCSYSYFYCCCCFTANNELLRAYQHPDRPNISSNDVNRQSLVSF